VCTPYGLNGRRAGGMIGVVERGTMLVEESRAMTTEEMILDKCRALSPDKKEEVLHFVESIGQKASRKKPYPSLRGLWKGHAADITEEDIAQARREMWGNFPREI